MKIGIISDTHDNLENIDKVLEILEKHNVSIIYHCGDWVTLDTFSYFFKQLPVSIQVKGVFGNNEKRYSLTKSIIDAEKWPLQIEERILEDVQDNLKIAVYHGTNSNLTNSLIQSQKYNLVLTGHSHRSLVKQINNTTHINPGQVTDRSAILTKPSIAIYDTKSKKVMKILLDNN